MGPETTPTRRYDYKWERFHTSAAAVLVLGAIAIWKKDAIPETEIKSGVIVGVFAVVGLLSWGAFPLRRITLNPSEIRIDYLFPLRRSLRFEHTRITSYREIIIKLFGKEKLAGGMLETDGGPKIMMLESETREFEELNAQLKKLYPLPSPEDHNKENS